VSQPRPGSEVPMLLIGDFGSMVEVGTLIDDDQEGDGKYIAPEVFKPNYQASTKFDIFSLALCIIEIATGEQVCVSYCEME
jgi:serine/threonine protein kinase